MNPSKDNAVPGDSHQSISLTSSSQNVHRFWSTQPVVHDASILDGNGGPVHEGLTDTRPEPYKLPPGFDWCVLNYENNDELDEIFQFLRENYVEDVDSTLRFAYSHGLLKWFMKSPGTEKEWQMGVRATGSGKLLATIMAAHKKLRLDNKEIDIVEIDFLCVIKKLRTKRLSPILIKEITRRVNKKYITQALFTGGKTLPGLVTTSPYWHRSINVDILLKTNFIQVPPNIPIEKYKKQLLLKKTSKLALKPMVEADIPQVCAKINEFSSRFRMACIFNEESFRHWMLPREDFLYSYVTKDDTGAVTHFASFYIIPSTSLPYSEDLQIRVAYAYYYFYPVSTSAAENDTRVGELFSSILLKARDARADVFNCLEIMDNRQMLDQHKFVKGDGHLNYYLYNWCFKAENSNQIYAVPI